MNPEDKKLFERWRIYPLAYNLSWTIALILSMFAIGLLIEFYVIMPSDGREPAYWAFDFLENLLRTVVAVDLLVWIYWMTLTKMGADRRKLEPYVVSLNLSNKEQIIERINENVELHEIREDILYGYRQGHKNIRLFMFSMQEYNTQEYKRIRKFGIRKAKKDFGMETELTRSQMHKANRINLLFLDKVDENAQKYAKNNAEYSMSYAESILNVIIDLEKMVMIIPAWRGTMSGNGFNYHYCVKKLLKWIEQYY